MSASIMIWSVHLELYSLLAVALWLIIIFFFFRSLQSRILRILLTIPLWLSYADWDLNLFLLLVLRCIYSSFTFPTVWKCFAITIVTLQSLYLLGNVLLTKIIDVLLKYVFLWIINELGMGLLTAVTSVKMNCFMSMTPTLK